MNISRTLAASIKETRINPDSLGDFALISLPIRFEMAVCLFRPSPITGFCQKEFTTRPSMRSRPDLGPFQRSDRRPELWNRFVEYLGEARGCSCIEAFLLDGSFVTASAEPNDIDLVVIVSPEHDFTAELPVGFYNVLAQNRVRRRFGIDIVVVKNATQSMNEAFEFFQQVRHLPALRKGIVRLKV